MNILKSHVQIGNIGAIFIILAVIIGPTTYVVNHQVKLYVYNKYVSSLKTEADSFELVLQEGLVKHNFDLVQQLLTDVGHSKSVSAIRLLNLQGVVRASSNAEEVGVQLDRNSPDCTVCHFEDGEYLPFHQLITSGDRSGTTILIANPLTNRVVCQACHTDGKLSRGVILVEYYADDIYTWQRNFSLGMLVGGVFIFIILFGCLGLFQHLNITRPLRKLTDGTRQHNLANRNDEIGVLAKRLSLLETTVAEQEQQVNNQRRNFNALVSISSFLDDSISVENIYRVALGTIQEVTGFSTIAMRQYDSAQNCFRLVVHNGMSPRMVKELRCYTTNFPLHAVLMSTRQVVRLSEDASGPVPIHASSKEAGYRTVLCVPFISGDRLLGSMELSSKEVLNVSEDEVRWLELVGRVIGSLLQQVELMERLRGMAMLQERAYVAQEIHDGLAQLLGSLRIWAEEAQLAMEEGNSQSVRSAIRKIEVTARDAYSSLREEILGLRETFQPGEGILPVVSEFLKRYQRQWGIQAQLQINSKDEEEISKLDSPPVEIQLLRMIQEALTNVRRHSRADRVLVQFSLQNSKLIVEVIDNGMGFDPEKISDEKVGLRIMRERAEQIDGTVIVETTPGQGTRLVIEVPR